MQFWTASKNFMLFYVVNKLVFNLMMPIVFLAKYCVYFILTFSNKYSNMELLVILFL